jgi:hypothetical protein
LENHSATKDKNIYVVLTSKVLLTKDNLAEQAKIMWHIVHMAFNIIPPTNITNLFGDWLVAVSKHDKIQI